LEFKDFANQLGLQRSKDQNSLPWRVAHHMFALALPPEWSEHLEPASSKAYFFNGLTGETCWTHPVAAIFKSVLEEVASWRPEASADEVVQSCESYLRRSQAAAVQALSQWSGPHHFIPGPEDTLDDREADHFYFNHSTEESSWVDPKLSLEFALQQQHNLLCLCIAEHAQGAEGLPVSLRSVLDSESCTECDSISDGGQSPVIRVHPPTAATSRRPQLLLPLAQRELRQGSTSISEASPLHKLRAQGSPMSEASPCRGKMLLQVPHPCVGDESVKSFMSYCSAFSEISDEVQRRMSEADFDNWCGSSQIAAAC